MLNVDSYSKFIELVLLKILIRLLRELEFIMIKNETNPRKTVTTYIGS